ARSQSLQSVPRGRRRQGLPQVPVATARTGGECATARHARLAHRRQHLRDGGGELSAAQPYEGRGGIIRGPAKARGSHLRSDLQERGAQTRIREPYAQARRAQQLKLFQLASPNSRRRRRPGTPKPKGAIGAGTLATAARPQRSSKRRLHAWAPPTSPGTCCDQYWAVCFDPVRGGPRPSQSTLTPPWSQGGGTCCVAPHRPSRS